MLILIFENFKSQIGMIFDFKKDMISRIQSDERYVMPSLFQISAAFLFFCHTINLYVGTDRSFKYTDIFV